MKSISQIALITIIVLLPLQNVFAALGPHYLISDYEFTDWASMNMRDVERFLISRGSALTRYVDIRTRQFAPQIIFDSAIIYQINPKVLLTLLQKEQSLVENSVPSKDQYDWATGFAVCDSCNKSDPGIQQYRGFATQVDRAAWRLRYYLSNPAEFRFQTGATYVIDGTSVTMTNDATRALYTYTPHVHGNENFVQIWQRWFAKIYPDGSVLQDESTKSLWLIQNGKRRKFASRAIAASRTNITRAVRVSSLDIEHYDEGDPITYAQYTLLRSPRGTVYLLVGDSKRGFVDRQAFKILGFNPEEVEDAEWDTLNLIPDGPALTLQSSYPTGALLQDTVTGGVWYVQDGVKHALIARELLKDFTGKKIQKAKPDQLAQFETGSPLKLTDGTLIMRTGTDEAAVIANGERRPFPSLDTMKKLGYKRENVLEIPEKVWYLHPQSSNVMELEP